MKLQFKNEITLGNVLQILTVVGGIAAYFLSVEHRLTTAETILADHEVRITHFEATIYPLYKNK